MSSDRSSDERNVPGDATTDEARRDHQSSEEMNLVSSSSGLLRNRRRWLIGFAVGAVLLGAVVTTSARKRGAVSPPAGSELETASVKRAALTVTVEAEGVLESCSSETLISQVEWRTKIITLVPEGTEVERGDVLCELDASKLTTKLDQRRVYLTRAEAGLARAREEFEIQKLRNDRNIANTRMQCELAQLEAEKYVEAEFEQQQNKLDGARTIAEQELTRSQAAYDFTQRLSRKGYSNQTDVENARVGLFKSQIEYNVANDERRLHGEFTGISRRAQLEAIAQQRRGELDRVKQRAELAMLQREVSLKANQRSVMAHRRQFDRIQRNIEACTIQAPRAGVVVYADSRRSGVRKEDRIQPGVDVRYRQRLIELPDMAHMQCTARFHESQITFLSEGQPVIMQLDAADNEDFVGELAHVSALPVRGEWPHNEQRFYDAVVDIADEDTRELGLMPGLTANLEVEVERHESVLQVPADAVINSDDEHHVYVLSDAGPQPRQVLIDRSNDTSVEIVEGLLEGELVVLDPQALQADDAVEIEDF